LEKKVDMETNSIPINGIEPSKVITDGGGTKFKYTKDLGLYDI